MVRDPLLHRRGAVQRDVPDRGQGDEEDRQGDCESECGASGHVREHRSGASDGCTTRPTKSQVLQPPHVTLTTHEVTEYPTSVGRTVASASCRARTGSGTLPDVPAPS